MSIAHEIQKLEDLRRTGVLSDQEFQQAKQRVLDGASAAPMPFGGSTPGMIFGFKERSWCMMIHLSQLLFFAGGLGLIVPIVMWATTKDQSEQVDQHGARMINWLLSSLIYVVVSGILCVVVIGIPMLIAVFIMNIVFPIMAAMKANNGQLWSYPLTIRFFPENQYSGQQSWN